MSRRIDLPESHNPVVRDVRVWAVSLSKIEESALAALASPCSTAELQRAERFVFERDRRSYLAAHGLLRHALSKYAPACAPPEWSFRAAPHGRPEIANPQYPHLRFNLSHCATRVACVICAEVDCGIDVEAATRPAASESMIRRYLSAREQEWVAAAAPGLRGERFLQLWTLKEALAKAVGLGLALPFEALDLDVDGAPRLRGAPPEAARPWWLSLRRSTDDHLEALALQVPHGDALALVYEEWTADAPPGGR